MNDDHERLTDHADTAMESGRDVQPPDEDEGDRAWDGAQETIQDPEELRVLFCALDSFARYGKVAHFNVTHLRRRSFYALPQSQWQMLAAPPFNFLETLSKTDDAIDSNATLAQAIVDTGLQSFGMSEMPPQWVGAAKHTDIDKARSTLRQFYRDWTEDGREEREACFKPVMEILRAERVREEGRQLKVLVPGAGLGRLVFDLANNGFDAEGNEISYHSLLASSYILNTCPRAGHHSLFPWAHSFSNHTTRTNHLRSYPVPDIHPGTVLGERQGADTDGTMAMCAADFLCAYGDEEHADTYDAVATVFFLDTAPNLIRYLEVIKNCLRPGGVLINIGPLLWHFENNAPGNYGASEDGDGDHDWKNSSGIADPGSFELAEDEVLALLKQVGFEVESVKRGIETPYIQDMDSMSINMYKSSFWVARKPASIDTETKA